ncbi:hypothetical protein T7160S_add [Escherichia phage T7]|nr:hypothetical protein T7130L_add [Escherichia phage T7]QZB84378.1 hypothetical protein T7140L_add [Escherichia phage T7]QZB84529.1 hypothetical protein T7160L_add [Escherichia phage T7]QZB84568.1 hypothetical protein T7160S_add [Escherichia phage T7]UJQ70433.1 hypothetical protein T75t1_17 [Escherichia phage T7]
MEHEDSKEQYLRTKGTELEQGKGDVERHCNS